MGGPPFACMENRRFDGTDVRRPRSSEDGDACGDGLLAEPTSEVVRMSHRLVIAPLAEMKFNGRGWYECTAARGILQLGGAAENCSGWALVQLKIGHTEVPLEFVARR